MKNDISGLRKNRAVNFKIGLIASLSFIIMAFNFSSTPSQKLIETYHEPMSVDEVEITRTKHEKPLPPPTVDISDHIEPVDEVALTEPTEPQTISIDIDEGPELPFDNSLYGDDDDEPEPDVEEPLDILVEEPVRDFAEYMPSFGTCNYSEMTKDEYKACSDAALLQYFAKHIKYPTRARDNKIEGRVILRFVIDENGDVQNAKALRGVPGGCTEEALKVLNSMPKWKAGRHGGRNVKVNFTLPVTFTLK